MNVSLKGKTAIVTGAASGIGNAIVRRFLAAGASGVVAVDLAPTLPPVDQEQSQSARSSEDKTLVYIRGDVSLETTAEQFTQAALDAFGRIDILVNNAGISVVKALHEHTPESLTCSRRI